MKSGRQVFFALGLLLGNTLSSHFLMGWSWFESFGQGFLAAVLFILIMGILEWLVEWYNKRKGTQDE